MTRIKLAKIEDLYSIEMLHKKYYKDSFEMPSLKNFLSTFVIHDEQSGELVLFGGARLLVEVIAMTNKGAHPKLKHDALYKFLHAVEEVSHANCFNQIHIFPEQDEKWRARLKKDGFKETRYPCYVR